MLDRLGSSVTARPPEPPDLDAVCVGRSVLAERPPDNTTRLVRADAGCERTLATVWFCRAASQLSRPSADRHGGRARLFGTAPESSAARRPRTARIRLGARGPSVITTRSHHGLSLQRMLRESPRRVAARPAVADSPEQVASFAMEAQRWRLQVGIIGRPSCREAPTLEKRLGFGYKMLYRAGARCDALSPVGCVRSGATGDGWPTCRLSARRVGTLGFLVDDRSAPKPGPCGREP